MLMLLPLLSDVVLLSRCPRYSLQITSEDNLVFSDQETKTEMLEEWEVAVDFTKLIWSLYNVDSLWISPLARRQWGGVAGRSTAQSRPATSSRRATPSPGRWPGGRW